MDCRGDIAISFSRLVHTSLPYEHHCPMASVALLSFYLSFRFMKSGGVISKINVLLSSISTVLVVVFVFNFTDNCLGERKESVTDVRLLMKYREEHNYRGSHHTIYKYKVQPMHGASRKVTVDSNTYYKYDVGDTIKLNTFEGFWNTIRVKSVE